MSCPAYVFWNLNSNNSCSANPWFLVEENKKIFYYVENSKECGGECCEAQSGTAIATINVGPFDVWLSLNYENISQLQNAGQNILTVSLNDGIIFTSQSKGGGIGCYSGPGDFVEYTKLPVKLNAFSQHTFKVEYNSQSATYHINCYAMVELLFDCVEPSQTSTPTPTLTPQDCTCRNCWCSSEECITKTPTRTPPPTPTPTQTHTPTQTYTPTYTQTPSPCADCYYYDIVVDESDLLTSGLLYVTYKPCGSQYFVTSQFNQAGTYEDAICVRDCTIPQVCTDLNPCIGPSGNSYVVRRGLCTPVTSSCPVFFEYDITEPGQIQLNTNVDLGQTFGNIDVTVSSSNFPEIVEVFVGVIETNVGEVFSFSKGSGTQTKKVGFYAGNYNKSTVDFFVYSESTLENPFVPYKVNFSVSCPYVDPCETTPSTTPCPTVTPTPSSPTITRQQCVVSSDWGAWRLIRIGSPELAFLSGRIDNGLNLLFLPNSFKFPFYTFCKGIRLQVRACSTGTWTNIYSMTTIWGNSIYFPSSKLVITNVAGVETYKMLISPYRN